MLLYPLRHQWVAPCNKDYGASTAHNVERCSTSTYPVACWPSRLRKRAYPQALHSGRAYRPEWEEELVALEQVWSYLAQGQWFRNIGSNGVFHARSLSLLPG
jgi:hypothetical protein